MGLNIIVNKWDVDSYIKWMDVNNDGKISLPEFEKVVEKSLKMRGIKI
jgi:Ca2+-binding EF-hand superfamily protein